MSCGCVPLVSDLECFEDFLKDGHNGFQVKTQTKEWTGAFLEALKNMLDHAEMEQMSQDAYRTAQNMKLNRWRLNSLPILRSWQPNKTRSFP